MKILFLDIDGVLNCRSGYQRDKPKRMQYMTAECVEALNYIVREVSDLKIVISSSWRFAFPMQEIIAMLGEAGNAVIDNTPRTRLSDDVRGNEIQAWLDAHPEVENFVILDDNSDMRHLIWRLRKTDFETGLTKKIADLVISDFDDLPCECAHLVDKCDCNKYDELEWFCHCHRAELANNYGRVVAERDEYKRMAEEAQADLQRLLKKRYES